EEHSESGAAVRQVRGRLGGPYMVGDVRAARSLLPINSERLLRRATVRHASAAFASRPNQRQSRSEMKEAAHPWDVVEQGDAADEAGFSCRRARADVRCPRAGVIESGFAADPRCSADAG